MHTLEIHYDGQFVHQPEFNYVGGKIAYFNDVDPDLISYFEVLDCLKEIGVDVEIPIYYMVPNFDLEHGRRLFNFDKIVLEMFEVNMNHKVIAIYSGEAANNNNHVDVNGINNNQLALVEANEGAYHEGGIGGVGQSEGDSMDDVGEQTKSEKDLDFDYFLDRGNYEAYIANKGKGKMQEKEVVSDDEILNAAFNSSDDKGGDEFPEFNAEREMEKPELVVGQLFSNATEFREAVRQHSIINGFELLYRAKNKAIKSIQGEHKQQYCILMDYCTTIIDRNHGSVAIVVTERYPMYENPIFKRMFVMFSAQKEGFIATCRHVIGLDACLLKCTMGGQLMVAIGRDANNQMYPLAIALVKSECKDR
ncbi:hypothetical protein ACH5RR_001644 [Cinchona calisaya]|uniref:PB1-like domain-containing protein n=1 Tax=Cinchona calisaya TaxID=153742 RepID=A0ABD3B4S9_9GENT